MNVHAPIDTSLGSRAMIVSLTITQWSGHRLDRSVTNEVTAQHSAASDAGNFNKHLLPKEALAPVTKISSATRTDFLERTLPWLNDGSRIMNAAGFLGHAAWFQSQRLKFEAAVDDFIAKYPTYVIDAQRRLGTMFVAGDYPDASELRRKFSMHMQIMPAPDAKDFRVAMSEAQVSEIRSQIEDSIKAATNQAVRHVYERVGEAAKRMVERLGAYKPSQGKDQPAEGIFRDSLVSNVRDLCNVLPQLNITGDVELDRIGEELRQLGRFDADILRNSDSARAATKAKAEAILTQIGDFLA